MQKLLVALCPLLVLLGLTYSSSSFTTEQPIVIDLTKTSDMATRIAVQNCVGLYNRNNLNNNGAYTLMNEPYDSDWLKDLYNIITPNLTSIDDFMTMYCLNPKTGVSNGYIAYNYSLQKVVAPNLITLAAVTNSVLLETNSPWINDLNLTYVCFFCLFVSFAFAFFFSLLFFVTVRDYAMLFCFFLVIFFVLRTSAIKKQKGVF